MAHVTGSKTELAPTTEPLPTPLTVNKQETRRLQAPFVADELDFTINTAADFMPTEWSSLPYRPQATEIKTNSNCENHVHYIQLNLAPNPPGNVSAMIRLNSSKGHQFAIVLGITSDGGYWCDMVLDPKIDWEQSVFSLHHEYMGDFEKTACLPMLERDDFKQLKDKDEGMVEQDEDVSRALPRKENKKKFTWAVYLDQDVRLEPWTNEDSGKSPARDSVFALFTLPDGSEHSFIEDRDET